jgi:hypothetical protein
MADGLLALVAIHTIEVVGSNSTGVNGVLNPRARD